MSFKVGDYVEHVRLPHIYRITETADGFVGSSAVLELYWEANESEVDWGVGGFIATLLKDIQAGMAISFTSLCPTCAMKVIAVEASRDT